jgi:hypothetical protein
MQAFKLKLLFDLPTFGRVGRQCPDDPTAGPGTNTCWINHPHLGAAPRAGPRD